ncbi:Xaa-pro dipeptidase, partial [Operophtera brumata]
MAATWCMGPGTLQVPLSLFAKNRERLAEKLKSGQVVVLQGGDEVSFYDTDVQYNTFRQSYFTWVCGVREPGCYFALDVTTKKGHLFVPRLPEEYEVWMGKLLSCEDFKKIYASGPNTDSEEIEVMRYVCKISSEAHKQPTSRARSRPTASSARTRGSCTRPCSPHGTPSSADITCSFPANGKFSEDQRLVYEAVLAARDAVIDMHLTANRVMLEHLKKGGLLKGDVDQMIE